MDARPFSESDKAPLLAALRQLHATCIDGERGYRTFASLVEGDALKALFISRATERMHFGEAIASMMQRLGDPAAEAPATSNSPGGTLLGSAHQKWVELKAQLGEATFLRVLGEAERGERAARKSYESALSVLMPVDMHSELLTQFASVRHAHEILQELQRGLHG